MRHLTLTITFAAILAATHASATDFGHDTDQGEKLSKERSLSEKKSKDEKTSTTQKKGKTSTQGKDSTSSTSSKKSGTVGANYALDLILPAQALFSMPVTRYLLPADFGWTGQISETMFSITSADYLKNRALANAELSYGEEQKIKAYIKELVEGGAKVGQAVHYLQQDLGKFGNVKKAKDGSLEVQSIGGNDLTGLAKGAMNRATEVVNGIIEREAAAEKKKKDPAGKDFNDLVQLALTGKTPQPEPAPKPLPSNYDQRIMEKFLAAEKDLPSCRFAGEISKIQCGTISLDLGSPPSLKIDGVEWYGGSYAGVNASYKVSSAWSYSEMLEQMKSDSKYAKTAIEAATTAEKMEAEGKYFEAAMLRKSAVDKGRVTKAGVGPGKFVPSIH